MKERIVRGCPVSALSLGTVQFGIPYGLNSAAGKTDSQAAFRIMDIARENGVNWLDTAAAYGDSEAVIGEWLRKIPQESQPFVATKVNSLDHTSLRTLRESLSDQIAQSAQKLGVEQIPLVMIHHCEEYFDDPDNMRQVFEEMKTEGRIQFSGMSAYAFHDYKVIAQSGFDAVQIPVNLFDWRQIVNGGIQALAEADMVVFARSVYLQGLVFRKPEQLGEGMKFCTDVLNDFHEICDEFSMEPGQLAASFALSLPGISSLVIGCRSEKQIQSTLHQIRQAKELTNDQMLRIRNAFENVDERVITPMLWNRA